MQAFSENFTGLELEDGGGRGTSGYFLSLFSALKPLLLVVISIYFLHMSFSLYIYCILNSEVHHNCFSNLKCRSLVLSLSQENDMLTVLLS